MSEESIKRITKRYRKSEREEKGLKVKKARKSGSETAENGHDLQHADPSIEKLELKNVSTSPNTLNKVKVSRKRKRTDRHAMPDESVNFETDATELELQRNKKCDEYQEEDRMCRLPYPDPAIDESLSEQSRRALLYAYEQCRGSEVWKFNKARQNWLLRNVWSEQAVPENYMPLVIKYLVGIRGGAREKLIRECISKTSTSKSEGLMQGTQPLDDSAIGSTINQQPNTSRALVILHALNKSS